MISLLKKRLARRLIRRLRPGKWPAFDEFAKLYARASSACESPMPSPPNISKMRRRYVMLEFLRATPRPLAGVAECGCWRGVSSWLIADALRSSAYEDEFVIIDSFEGLSTPAGADGEKNAESEGLMACTVEQVAEHLREFDFVTFHKGWIPQVLNGLPDRRYSFVSIDLDLYEPIKGALEYFYPRTLSGGCIVVDDYSPRWPGAMRAVDEFSDAVGCRRIDTTLGSAVILKR